MKISLKIVVALAVLVYSCSQTEQTENQEQAAVSHPQGQASVADDESDANILQVAIGSKDHSTLVAAVQAAQIEHVLVNAGPLTAFAPTNVAFEKLPEGTVEDLLKPENKSTLATVLTRHAAPGSFNLEGLKKEADKGRKLYMATGDYLEVTTDGTDVLVNGIKVIASIQTSNGIINVIEEVILL